MTPRSCSASSPPSSAARCSGASAGTCGRVRGAVDRRFFAQLLGGAFLLVLIAAPLITVVEKPLTFASLGASVNWGVQTILGQGDSSYVTSPVGWVVGWFFSLFGVAIIGTLTGALVALVIDFLLKEGQGLGAIGLSRSHRRLRLEPDRPRPDRRAPRRRVQGPDRRPRRGSTRTRPAKASTSSTATRPTRRPSNGPASARRKAALIFPTVASNEADMHSILTIMAIESMAPAGPDRRRGEQPRATSSTSGGRGSTRSS